MTDSRLVIGPGGTGRTHRLARWAEAIEASGDQRVARLVGSPLRPVSEADVAGAVTSAPGVIVADDLQWFEAGALGMLTEYAADVVILASRRPATGVEPAPDTLEFLCELLARAQPVDRLGPLDLDAFVAAVAGLRRAAAEREGATDDRALATGEVEGLFTATAGSIGLAADAVAAGWNGVDEPPSALLDAAAQRCRRGVDTATGVLQVWAVLAQTDPATPIETALTMADDDVDLDVAERELRAAGLVIDDPGVGAVLIPLVVRAVLHAMTAAQRSMAHDRIAERLADNDPLGAAQHLLSGDGQAEGGPQVLATAALRLAVSEPDQADEFIDRAQRLGLPEHEGALLRALAAFHRGSPAALQHLDLARQAAPEGTNGRAALLGYGIDLRDLRFESASQRPIEGDLAEPLRALADGIAGRPRVPDRAARTPLAALVAVMAGGIEALAAGRSDEALGAMTSAVDDFDRMEPSAPLGMTPHALGSLVALGVGDLDAVDLLTKRALEQTSGGIGEAFAHRLLRAYGQLVAGDHGPALTLLRDHTPDDDAATAAPLGDSDGPDHADPADPLDGDELQVGRLLCQRDRLLLATLEAAIARRSGDTGRLRAAWRRAQDALIRPATSWLLIDFFIELLSCGARLGDRRRVDPVLDAVVAQATALPAKGPAPTAAHWLRLQVALAADDRRAVAEQAEALAGCSPGDDRAAARVAAGAEWAGILAGRCREDAVTATANRLRSVGDPWEASRLLGQAALVEADPRAARRLLEAARHSAVEQVDEGGGEGLAALGLSEREAEVAVLITEGRTHKEVGAQLYISPKTVEHHVAKIRQKLGAGSRAELISIVRDATAAD